MNIIVAYNTSHTRKVVPEYCKDDTMKVKGEGQNVTLSATRNYLNDRHQNFASIRLAVSGVLKITHSQDTCMDFDRKYVRNAVSRTDVLFWGYETKKNII